MRGSFLPLMLVVMLMSGCSVFGGADAPDSPAAPAGNGAQDAAQVQPQSDEWRMQSLEKSFLEFREEQARQRAEVQQRLEEQEQTLKTMRSQLSEMERKNAKLQADVMAAASTAQARANARPQASVRMEPSASPSSAPRPTPRKKVEPRPAAKAPANGLNKKTALKKAPAKRLSGMNAGGGKDLYERALKHVQVGNADEARKLFNEFLSDNPKSPLVPNALYWLGETYYHDKRYAQSILTFKEVVRKFPKHNKAAASMLKAGYAYERLGDASNAEFYLRTLLEDYPGSEPARLAAKKLKSMGL